jgi:hypothetical protein
MSWYYEDLRLEEVLRRMSKAALAEALFGWMR